MTYKCLISIEFLLEGKCLISKKFSKCLISQGFPEDLLYQFGLPVAPVNL